MNPLLPSLAFSIALALPTFLGVAADHYELGPDSTIRPPGTPAGRIENFAYSESKVFPNTHRDGWVYVPAQYDGKTPAALMVFQDGHAYVSAQGQMRVPIVFDNLIARGEMPVTIGIFINPGHEKSGEADGWRNRSNRSVEYDSLGDHYARFLIDELIPHVATKFKLNLTSEARLRAISGMSSGGICAFTAAWERPTYFSKVLSHIGSFVNIRGGHVYPALIRKTPRKPIRVFLQDGSNDLNNQHGDWPLANQEMFTSLNFAGYETKFVFGDGAHNGKHGGAILPESLRWLWQPERVRPTSTNLLSESLFPVPPVGDAWELVGKGYSFTDAACADALGNFYFSDLPKGIVYRVASSGGTPVPWLSNELKISGLKFGVDEQLYACVQGQGTNNVKKVVSIDPVSKQVTELATDVQPNDLAVSSKGWVYFTDTGAGQVVSVPTGARRMSRPRPAFGGINRPNGIAISRDESQLYVSEYGGTHLWVFELDEKGQIASGERIGTLQVPSGKADSGGDGMIADVYRRTFVTSHLGIQIFEESGRFAGLIPRPQEKGTVSCAFAGPRHSWLYACSSDKVYRRKSSTHGFVPRPY